MNRERVDVAVTSALNFRAAPSPAAHQVSPPAKPKSPAPSSSSSLLKPKTEPVISEDRREDAATEDTVVGSVIPSVSRRSCNVYQDTIVYQMVANTVVT